MSAIAPTESAATESAEPPTSGSGMPAFMVERVAAVRAELAEADSDRARSSAANAENAWRARSGSRNSSSVVFTLRLGREDFAELHRQSLLRNVAPSVLARNLIRVGLAHRVPTGSPHDLTSLADRVRAAAR